MHLIARVLVFNIKDKDHGSHSQTMGHRSEFRWVTGSWITFSDQSPALEHLLSRLMFKGISPAEDCHSKSMATVSRKMLHIASI